MQTREFTDSVLRLLLLSAAVSDTADVSETPHRNSLGTKL
jgi:hypothetical protein